MTTLVVGASGATGKLLVDQLLGSGHSVKVIVRSTSTISDSWRTDDKVTIVWGNIDRMSVGDMVSHLADCQSVISCLGHTLTWKGMYGTKKLVTDARSEEHTSELQSLMRTTYAVFCLNTKTIMH